MDEVSFLEKVKQRLLYHAFVPLVFIIIFAFILRNGELFGAYCGHIALLSILMFMIISIYYDHKETYIDILLWSFIRIIVYSTIGVGVAIFTKKIMEILF